MRAAYLSQSEADRLIRLEKHSDSDQQWDYPALGGSISIGLVSADRREEFILDISRGRIDLLKGKYQTRAHQAVVLVRVDFGSRPHQNPDGEAVGCPHIHIYREGFGDRWAYPLPPDRFAAPDDLRRTLQDFLAYCNVTKPPRIEYGLFP